jgi:hypothetical protein
VNVLNVSLFAKTQELEDAIRKLAELHVLVRERRRDEEFAASELLVRAMHLVSDLEVLAEQIGSAR